MPNQIKNQMAHNLNFNKKKGNWSFVSHKEKAWHGLGTIVENAMTANQVIELANLDYEVSKTEIYAGIDVAKEENGEPVGGRIFTQYGDKFATYRTDTNEVLGIVGGRYEIVQNKDAFTFFDSIIDSGEAIFETAGALGKGEKIFVTAKLPNDFEVKGDKCDKYILLTNSHDGSSAIIAGFTTIRVVCNNTLQASLHSLDNKVSIRHNPNAKEKLSEAYRVMGIASEYMKEIEKQFNKMANTKISDVELKNYISKVLMPKTNEKEKEESKQFKNLVEDVIEFTNNHETQKTEATQKTLWGAYNGISGYFNYSNKWKNDEMKFKSQMFGTANTKIIKAFDEAVCLLN